MMRLKVVCLAAVFSAANLGLWAAVATVSRPADVDTRLPGLTGNINGAVGAGNAIDPESLQRENAYTGGIGSHAQRLNGLAAHVQSGGSGTNVSPGTGGGRLNLGTDDRRVALGQAQVTENALAAASRLHNQPQPPVNLSSEIKGVVADAKPNLDALPATARNFIVSIAYAPEAPSQGLQAVKAIAELGKMQKAEATAYFSLPGLVNDSQRAIFYRSRIQKLASGN